MGESRTLVQTRRFRVAGLSDADCAVRVEHALLSVPGVHKAFVDIEQEQAILRVAEYITDDALAEAVDSVGYTLIVSSNVETDEDFASEPEPEPEAPQAPSIPDVSPTPQPRASEPLDVVPEAFTPWWLRAWYIASRAALYGITASIVLTILYRFVPVPTTLLMLSEGLIEGRPIQNNWVSLRQISPHLIRSVIASEDNEFCRHWGFDFKEMEDAVNESKRGGRLRGASTISQQTAKNVFLWPDRSWVRKGLEAYFTLLIEGLWPKHRIMEVYLNVIEWGPGVFGADAASRKWFGKSAASLTRLEAARLAAILPNPIRYRANPPGPYVNNRGYTISARANSVDLNGDDRCARP